MDVICAISSCEQTSPAVEIYRGYSLCGDCILVAYEMEGRHPELAMDKIVMFINHYVDPENPRWSGDGDADGPPRIGTKAFIEAVRLWAIGHRVAALEIIGQA